jgi:CRP-like cAMP-binding protein
MIERDRLLILRRTKEFAVFDEARLKALLPFIDEACLPAGAVVAQEGRLCHEFVIVATGELETCRQGGPGSLGPGDAFGWKAMRDRSPHDATVKTLSPAHVLVMSHEQFRAADALALSN